MWRVSPSAWAPDCGLAFPGRPERPFRPAPGQRPARRHGHGLNRSRRPWRRAGSWTERRRPSCSSFAPNRPARQRIATAMLPAGTYTSDPHAFHVWITLPEGWTRSAFASHGRSAGLGVIGSDPFCVAGTPPEAVRLCLGGPSTRQQITHGLEVLAHALEGSPGPRVSVHLNRPAQRDRNGPPSKRRSDRQSMAQTASGQIRYVRSGFTARPSRPQQDVQPPVAGAASAGSRRAPRAARPGRRPASSGVRHGGSDTPIVPADPVPRRTWRRRPRGQGGLFVRQAPARHRHPPAFGGQDARKPCAQRGPV